MTNRDRFDPGTISWVDLQTPDPAAARRFYGELLGWTFLGGEDPSTGFYTMCQLGGRNVAGMAKIRDGSSVPPMWSTYFSTADTDATSRAAQERGAQVLMPPLDVMDLGRMAYFADPTGAPFGIWQPRKHTGAQVVDEPGAMCWHETYTRDGEKAKSFYTSVFGLEAKKLDAPGVDYWTLDRGATQVCGLMQIGKSFPEGTPSHWNTYFAVKDADASTDRVTTLGGKVRQPAFDTPYGRMSAVTDPFGANFCLIVPARR